MPATVLVVLHDLSLAARCCDDLVLLMPDGRQIGGTTRSVLTPDLLRAAYGVSFTVTQVADTPMVIPQSDFGLVPQTMTESLAHAG